MYELNLELILITRVSMCDFCVYLHRHSLHVTNGNRTHAKLGKQTLEFVSSLWDVGFRVGISPSWRHESIYVK